MSSSYRWIIVGLAFCSIAVCDAIWISFSLFLVALTGNFRWSYGATAAIFSWMLVATALSGPLVGALIDRFGARRVLPAGGLALALGLFLCSAASSLWQFYAAYALLIGTGMSGLSTTANFTVLQQWFSTGRGTVMGLADAGGGLGILILVPLMQAIITARGYRPAYVALAGIALALGVLHLVLQRRSPCPAADSGAQTSPSPDDPAPAGGDSVLRGAAQGASAAQGDARGQESEQGGGGTAAAASWTARQARRTPTFWLLLLGLTLLSGVTALLSVHQVAAIMETGFAQGVAASAVGLAGLANAAGKLSLGALSDRLGRPWAFGLSVAAIIVSILLLLAASAWPLAWLPYAFALLLGAGIGVGMPLFAALVGDVFGRASFGAIFGLIGLGAGIGGAVGPVLGGYLFDLVGSYRGTFMVCIAVAAASWLCFWTAARIGRTLRWSV